MCGHCGCSDPMNEVTLVDTTTGVRRTLGAHDHPHRHGDGHDHAHDHAHHHSHDHAHAHEHAHAHAHAHDDKPHRHGPGGEVILLETAVLSKNDALAARNREGFAARGVLALNLVSSPGAGKTTLLERTIAMVAATMPIAVIEGDQMTTNDAERIRQAGARAVQINTGAGCHLEADMVAEAVQVLEPEAGSVLMIENVGNLVCPAMFDLGEKMKVAIASTTEGEDKPLKYPHIFRAAGLVIVNKIDLAPYVEFDEAAFRRNVRTVNPDAPVIAVSAKTGEGLDAWTAFIERERAGTASEADPVARPAPAL